MRGCEGPMFSWWNVQHLRSIPGRDDCESAWWRASRQEGWLVCLGGFSGERMGDGS